MYKLVVLCLCAAGVAQLLSNATATVDPVLFQYDGDLSARKALPPPHAVSIFLREAATAGYNAAVSRAVQISQPAVDWQRRTGSQVLVREGAGAPAGTVRAPEAVGDAGVRFPALPAGSTVSSDAHKYQLVERVRTLGQSSHGMEIVTAWGAWVQDAAPDSGVARYEDIWAAAGGQDAHALLSSDGFDYSMCSAGPAGTIEGPEVCKAAHGAVVQFMARRRQARYNIQSPVGRGGCGEVWRAIRLNDDGTPDTSASFVLKRMFMVGACVCVLAAAPVVMCVCGWGALCAA